MEDAVSRAGEGFPRDEIIRTSRALQQFGGPSTAFPPAEDRRDQLSAVVTTPGKRERVRRLFWGFREDTVSPIIPVKGSVRRSERLSAVLGVLTRGSASEAVKTPSKAMEVSGPRGHRMRSALPGDIPWYAQLRIDMHYLMVSAYRSIPWNGPKEPHMYAQGMNKESLDEAGARSTQADVNPDNAVSVERQGL